MTALAAVITAYRAQGITEPSKADLAVAHTLAGESLSEIGWELELTGDELREASLRVYTAKPKPKPSRQRQVSRRWS